MENNINNDLNFVKSILPKHYNVKESNKKGSIHCKSSIGLRNGDQDDDEHFSYVIKAIKDKFKNRFLEVFHNTCTYHQDFTIYLSNT